MNKFLKIGLLFITGVLASCLNADTHSPADEDSVNSAPAVKWEFINEIIGRQEEEYDKVKIVRMEIKKLSGGMEDLRDIQIYPSEISGLTGEAAVTLDKMLDEREKDISGFKSIVGKLKNSLKDEILILNELINEDLQPDMFSVLKDNNLERVKRIILLKREINHEWRKLEEVIDYCSHISGADISKDNESGNLKGFDEDFFRVINSSLGYTSNLFYEKLSELKNHYTEGISPSERRKIIQIELVRARNRIRNGDYEIAADALEKAYIRFEQKSGISAINFFLGKSLFALGRYADAFRNFKEIPESSVKYYQLALEGKLQSAYAMKNYEKTINVYEEIQEKMRGFTAGIKNSVNLIAAQAYYEHKKYDKAVSINEKIISSAPYSGALLFVIGKSYCGKGDFKTARSIFKKTSQAEPENKMAEFIAKESVLMLAYLDFESGDYKGALEKFYKVINYTGYYSRALYGIVWCYLKRNEIYKAEVSIKKLINLEPESEEGAEALFLLSQNYLKKAVAEWNYKNSIQSDVSRLQKYKESIRTRVEMGLADSGPSKTALARIDDLIERFQKKRTADYSEIKSYFELGERSSEFLVKVYGSGRYKEQDFLSAREKLSSRIEGLVDKLEVGGGPVVNSDYLLMDNLKRKKTGNILDIVSKSRTFHIKCCLEKYRWEDEYSSWYVRRLNSRIRQEKEKEKEESDSLVAGLEEAKEEYLRVMNKSRTERRQTLIGKMEEYLRKELKPAQRQFIYYHLAEKHYERLYDEYQLQEIVYDRKIQKYYDDLELFSKGALSKKPEMPDEPVKDYSLCLDYYDRAIEIEDSDYYKDAALYGKAFCYRIQGEEDSSRSSWERIVYEFPESRYASQSYLLLGEYHFYENNLDEAVDAYRGVLKYPESEWFDEALYKLGWTYYRLSNTQKAISTFFYLLTESTRFTDALLESDFFKTNLFGKEAIDYIAISFAESDTSQGYEGVSKAKKFIARINNPFIGSRILHKMGDVYSEQLKFAKSIQAYRTVLSLFPGYDKAPEVKSGIVTAYEKDNKIVKAQDERISLFEDYNYRSEWCEKKSDTSVVNMADSMARESLWDAALYFHYLVQKNRDPEMVEKVKQLYGKYVSTYKNSERTPEAHFNVADIYDNMGEYYKAAKIYMAVSRKYPDSPFRQKAAWNAIVAAKKVIEEEKKGNSAE
ncbi:MAG: tetratricopeptide repeat protein [Fibrobacterota bacterium]